MSKVRKCYLCGQSYKYCPTCSQDLRKPSWMTEFHNENCKNIFDICTRFNMDMLSKKQAQDLLIDCDLSNQANFKSYVQRDLDVIFSEDLATADIVYEIVANDMATTENKHEVVVTENE